MTQEQPTMPRKRVYIEPTTAVNTEDTRSGPGFLSRLTNRQKVLKRNEAMSAYATGNSVLDKEAVQDYVSEHQIQHRHCTQFYRNTKLNQLFCQCGREWQWHVDEHLVSGKEDEGLEGQWEPDKHSKPTPANAFGEISFRGFGHETRNRAPYVRMGLNMDYVKQSNEIKKSFHEMSEEEKSIVDQAYSIKNIWDLMTEHWDMSKPSLIISVTGGAAPFEMRPRLLESFKRGLIKAATITGAWIITGGTNTGVMKYVGEAVKEHIQATGSTEVNKVVSLGVATWGGVDSRDVLQGYELEGCFPALYRHSDLYRNKGKPGLKGVPLDQNHSHFILVDNGTENQYGAEMSFRANLEDYISHTIKTEEAGMPDELQIQTPVVLIVVEGGANTIFTVSETVSKRHPVVIVKGSGRAADLLTFAYENTKVPGRPGETKFPDGFDKKLEGEVGNLFKKLNYNEERFAKEMKKSISGIENCLKYRELINIYSPEDSKADISTVILDSMMWAKNNEVETQLSMSLIWNQHLLAKKNVFVFEKDKNRPTKPRWEGINLDDYMESALINDRIEFVKLFMENGVDIKQFLTVKRLANLYKKSVRRKYTSQACDLLRHKLRDIRISWTHDILPECCIKKDKDHENKMLQHVGQLIVRLLGDEYTNPYKDDCYIVQKTTDKQKAISITLENSMNGSTAMLHSAQSVKFMYAEKELFLWAIITNNDAMARLFWRISKDPLGGALTAAALLKALASAAMDDEEVDLAEQLTENADEWEELASGLLSVCYIQDKYKAFNCLIRRLPRWGDTSCFQIAHNAGLMRFIGNSCCQTKLNRVWLGNMALYTSTPKLIGTMICPLLVFLIKFVMLKKVRDQPKKEKAVAVDHKGKSVYHNPSYKPKVAAVQEASRVPHNVVCCVGNKSSAINFFMAMYYFCSSPVIKFGYNMVFYIIYLVMYSYFLLTDFHPTSPSILEIIIWGWTGTLIIEEFRQVISRPGNSVGYKVQSWFSDLWNKVDLIMYLIFAISVVLRYALTGDDFLYARMSYTLSLCVFYIRFMHMFFVQKNMGPKVIMIKRMMGDIAFFLLIFIIFCFGYGVVTQALLYPNTEFGTGLIKDVVYKPYFHMYGELFLDEYGGDVPGCSSNLTEIALDSSKPRCPSSNWLSVLLLAVYMVLTNVLLLNLLIAMFSYTFQKVQENSEMVWRFHRYSLIKEYLERPVLAPPFIIFNHLFRLVQALFNYLTGRPQRSNASTPEDRKPYSVLDRIMDYRTAITFGKFEFGCMEQLMARLAKKNENLIDHKVSTTKERIEIVLESLEKMKEHYVPMPSGYSFPIDDDDQVDSGEKKADGLNVLTIQVKEMQKNIDKIMSALEKRPL